MRLVGPRALGVARHDGRVAAPRRAAPGIAGLVLTPGASAGREQSGLVAIDDAVTRAGVAVERVEPPGRRPASAAPIHPRSASERCAPPPPRWRNDCPSRSATSPSAVALSGGGCAPWPPPRASRPPRWSWSAIRSIRPGAPNGSVPSTFPCSACRVSSSPAGVMPSPCPMSSSGRPPPPAARSPCTSSTATIRCARARPRWRTSSCPGCRAPVGGIGPQRSGGVATGPVWKMGQPISVRQFASSASSRRPTR